MKKILLISLGFLISQRSISQCEVNTAATQMTVTCGQSVNLSAFGSSTGSMILNENFNTGGFGAGWGATPGATSFSNPCSPGGVDGTPHAWMDNNTSVPRTLTSQAYNLTSATAGVSICFDLLFAEQGDAAPCEGPDEPDEGVYLQYSIDGGATWIDIYYFDPNGGNDPQLTNWNNYCFAIPPAAITANTIFRWHQLADSGADYDHWGIDNVQIFQNDINAEVEWLHDGYSYGVGNPGGVNPNAVTPTSTTTYTAQITTGTGQVCTSSITITVLAPVYDVNVTANPTTVCVGDCATISGTAQIVLDPGGIETYENNEFALVSSGSASVNINVQGINTTSITAGLIEEMVINGFNFSGSSLCTSFGGCPCNGATISFGQTCNLNTSGFTVTLTAPGGCDIILVPAGVATGNYSNTTFVPVGGSAFGGTFPNGGTWNPSEPFSGLNGCDPNGVWTLTFSAPGLGIGLGTLTGWSITFNDPPIYQPVNATWSPTAGLSSTNTINTTACPTSSTNYVLTLDNGTPGCPTYTETFPITVDPCGGCTPPVFTVTPPPAFCLPGTYNLTGAISGTGANIVTYHLTNADATNDANPMGSTIVSAAGTYFVRVEDPTDPTCFSVQSIVVTTTSPANATFAFANFCATAPNGPSGIVTPGGTFAFSPAPSDGATINTSTGVITNPVAGNSYSVQYTTSGACPSSSTVSVTATAPTNSTFTFANFCATAPNGPSGIVTPGGTFAFSPAPTDGATINTSTGVITNPVAGNSYSVQYTTSGACPSSSTVSVTATTPTNSTFTFANFCATAPNGPSGIVTPGGTFAFSPAPTDGATINTSTGVITNPVAGNSYSVQYTTSGACPSSTTVSVTATAPANATFNFINFCSTDPNGPSGIATPGGTFAFSPAPTDGATINTSTGVITNPIAGNSYSIQYTTSGACPASSTVSVTAIDCSSCTPPVFTVTNPAAVCDPTTIDLVSTVSGTGVNVVSYYANNADATAAVNPLGSTIVAVSGTYWVRVEDPTDPTCNTIQSIVVTINPIEDASFNFAAFCAGAVNGPSGIVTAGGTFAFNPVPTDGATIDAATGVISNGVATTTYTVEYTTAGACSSSSAQNVLVNDCSSCTPPAFTVTNPAAVCDPTTIDLVSTVSGTGVNVVSYYANNADATSAVNPLGSTIVAASGTYWVRVEDPTDPTCNTIQSIVVTINPIEDASFTFAAYCAGAVNGPSGIVTPGGTFAFNPAVTDGATIDATTGVISNGVATTTYTVEYTTAGICPSSSTQNVLVNDCIGCIPPVLTLNPGAFCAGTTFNLANTVDTPLGTVNYTYHATNLDATNDANAINSVITNPGTYWVRAEDSVDPTCFTVAQVTITEIPLPLIILSVTNTSCELSNGAIDATISAGSGNYSYTWSNSATTEDLANLWPGIYSLIVVDNLTGCTNNASASVQPSATPTAAFNMNPVVMNFPDHISVSDNLSNGATTYLWTVNGENFDFVSTSTDISLDLPIDTGNYQVCLIAFNGPDCSDTTCGYIEVRDEFIIWVPNTFTPDADEYNNVFLPVVSMIDIHNYDFFIFDRWGELIFESHDVNLGWDGSYKGRLVKEGVYTWKIRLKSVYSDEFRDYHGHVNMLR
jgi:gliding motility-associated-like protein